MKKGSPSLWRGQREAPFQKNRCEGCETRDSFQTLTLFKGAFALEAGRTGLQGAGEKGRGIPASFVPLLAPREGTRRGALRPGRATRCLPGAWPRILGRWTFAHVGPGPRRGGQLETDRWGRFDERTWTLRSSRKATGWTANNGTI